MKIAYYRDKQSGKIVRHCRVDDKRTMEEINNIVAVYNLDERKTDRVYIIEVKEGSFLEDLTNKCEEKIKFPKKVIEEAIDCLQNALLAVQILEVSHE